MRFFWHLAPSSFKPEIGLLFTLKSVFKVPWKIDFWSPISFRIDKDHNSLGDSNVDCGENNRPTLALKVSKEACGMGLQHSVRICIKIISF